MAIVANVTSKRFIRLSANDSISQAIGKLKKRKERVAVVFERNKLKGIFDRNSLLISKIDPSKSRIKNFTKNIPVVSPDEDLVTAAELMYHAYPCVLAVKKGNKFLGIVKAESIISQIKKVPKLARLKVSEVMTKNPIVFKYEARLGDVLSTMRENKIGRVPIIDKKGRAISVLSFTDIAERFLLKPKQKIRGRKETTLTSKGSKAWTPKTLFLLDTNVGDEASQIIISVSPKTRLDKAIDKMNKYNISDLIITENKKPVGIITTQDLLRVYMNLKEPEYWPIQYYGLNEVKPFQEKLVKELVQEFYEKVRRAYFKDVVYFMVHIKPYEEGLAGKARRHGRTKWSVSLRLSIPAHTFTTKQAHFHLDTALSWAIKEMERFVQEYKVKTRERFQKYKKGRRAMFERFIRKRKDNVGGPEPFSPLIKR